MKMERGEEDNGSVQSMEREGRAITGKGCVGVYENHMNVELSF